MKSMFEKLQVVPHSGSWMEWNTARKAYKEKHSKGYFIKETSREHWGVLILSSMLTWSGLHF